MNLKKVVQTCETRMSSMIEHSKTEVVAALSLNETTCDMGLNEIEETSLQNLKQIEQKCSVIRGKIEMRWQEVESIRLTFAQDLVQIQEVETIIEQKLDELSGGKSNQNAVLPVAIESNIKALHIQTKRAKHSLNILNKILDEGIDPIDLPMIAPYPGDERGMRADTLLAEIDSLKRELERTEASCAI